MSRSVISMKSVSIAFLGVITGFLLSSWIYRQKLVAIQPATLNSEAEPQSIQIMNLHKKPNRKIKILISGYWRTGSGFVGELFNQNPDAFYLVEPINGFIYPYLAYNLAPTPLSPKPIENDHMLNTHLFLQEDMGVDTIQRTDEEIAALLRLVYDCRIDQLPRQVLGHRVMRLSKALYQYNFCLGWNLQKTDKCKHIAKSVCSENRIIALKEVYVRMTSVEILLKYEPTLKIVHLIRDPRAILVSRQQRNIIPKNEPLGAYAKPLCDEILADIQKRELLSQSMPNTFLTLYFEDIIRQPHETAQILYKFNEIGNVPKEIKRWLANSVSSKEDYGKNGFQSSTRKRNSTATAYAWKQKISLSTVREIDQACSKLYRVTGYFQIRNEKELKSTKYTHRAKTDLKVLLHSL